MAISAKRFKFLDEETNVGVADFFDSKSADIFNSPNNELKVVTADLQALIASTTQCTKASIDEMKAATSGAISQAKESMSKATDAIGQAKSALNSVKATASNAISQAKGTISDLKSAVTQSEAASMFRKAKGVYGDLRDVSKMGTKALDAAVGELLPNNPIVQSTFSKMASKCKTSALGSNGFGKPFDLSMNCNGKKRSTGGSNSCNSGQFSDVLNKLTGGNYQSSFSDLNQTLKNLMGLSKFGYNMNMCGVFGALGAGLNGNVLSRAAGGLIGSLSSSKNVLGMFDLAGATAGLNVGLVNPSAVSSLFGGFKIPSEIKQYDLGDFNERLNGAAELYNGDWTTSNYDDMLSIGDMGGSNGDLQACMRGETMNNMPSEDNLDAVFDNENDFRAVAYSTNSFDSANAFKDGYDIHGVPTDGSYTGYTPKSINFGNDDEDTSGLGYKVANEGYTSKGLSFD